MSKLISGVYKNAPPSLTREALQAITTRLLRDGDWDEDSRVGRIAAALKSIYGSHGAKEELLPILNSTFDEDLRRTYLKLISIV